MRWHRASGHSFSSANFSGSVSGDAHSGGSGSGSGVGGIVGSGTGSSVSGGGGSAVSGGVTSDGDSRRVRSLRRARGSISHLHAPNASLSRDVH